MIFFIKKPKRSKQLMRGQVLAMLLVFTLVSVAITSAAIVIIINIAKSTNIVEHRIVVSQAAESGIENAIVRILRDPNYLGETLSVGEIIVTISVSGTSPKIVTSEAVHDNFIQKTQISINFVNSRLVVSDWKSIY